MVQVEFGVIMGLTFIMKIIVQLVHFVFPFNKVLVFVVVSFKDTGPLLFLSVSIGLNCTYFGGNKLLKRFKGPIILCGNRIQNKL